MPEQIVYSFDKGREEVRAIRQSWKGKDMICIRAFYADDSGEMRPGKNGITLPVDLLSELEKAVGALKKA